MVLFVLLQAVDKANGYVYGNAEERNIQRLLSCAVGAEFESDRLSHVKEASGDADDTSEEDEEEKLLRAYATQNPNMK